MAANTPVIWHPLSSAGTVRQGTRLQFLKNPYSGTGTQALVRWQIATDAGFTAVVWDTLDRAADGKVLTADTCDVPVDLIPLQQGTTYHVRCRVINSVPETSSYATAKTFVMEASITAADWSAGL